MYVCIRVSAAAATDVFLSCQLGVKLTHDEYESEMNFKLHLVAFPYFFFLFALCVFAVRLYAITGCQALCAENITDNLFVFTSQLFAKFTIYFAFHFTFNAFITIFGLSTFVKIAILLYILENLEAGRSNNISSTCSKFIYFQ